MSDTAATHLRRLGINPATVARLQQWADEDGMTLTEFVRYVLNDYAPPHEPQPEPIPPDYWETAQ